MASDPLKARGVRSALAGVAASLMIGVGWSAADPVADGNAGLEAMKAGQYDAAIKLFTHALSSSTLSNDDREFAYYQRGLAHLNRREYPLALSDLRRAAKLKPGDMDVQNAVQMAEARRPPNGVAAAAPEPEPANATAAAQAGAAALDRGQNDRAVHLFTRAIESKDLGPQDLDLAYFSRAKAYYKLGAEGPALSDLSQAMRLNPQDADAQAAVAQIASTHRRPVGTGPSLDLATCSANYATSGNFLGKRLYTTYAVYPRLSTLDAFIAAFNYAVAQQWNVTKVDYDDGALTATRDVPGVPGAIAVTVIVEANPPTGSRTTVKMQTPGLLIATDLKETMCDQLASLVH